MIHATSSNSQPCIDELEVYGPDGQMNPVIAWDAIATASRWWWRYFAYRPDKPLVEDWDSYWHLYAMAADGSGLRKLTDGPFHDFHAVCLPDGDLAFHTTR